MYRTMSVSCLSAISQMIRYADFNGYDVRTHLYGNALIHTARNTALAAVRPDADYVLFVDDDMLPEEDSLVRLLRHEKPVVSGLCTSRTPPIGLVCKVWKPEEGQFQPLGKVNIEKVIEGQFAVGAAFLLLSGPTIKALVGYVVSGQAALDQMKGILDFVEVSDAARGRLKTYISNRLRARYVRDKIIQIFDFPYDPMTGLQYGEDIALSRKLIELDIPVAIDGTVCPGHVGEYPFGYWDVMAQEEKERRPATPEEQLIHGVFPSSVEAFADLVMK